MKRIIFCFLILVTVIFDFSYAQEGMNMTLRSLFFPSNLNPGSGYIFNDVWGYVAPNGKEYAILGSSAGTYFIDVSNPTNPVEVDYKPGLQSTNWRDFKTYKNYAFGVADGGSHSLQIFDLQYLPDSVNKVYDSNFFSRNAHNIFINNDKLYLIGNSAHQVDILCIEDPVNPKHLGAVISNITVPYTINSAHDAFVNNDTIFLSAGNGGLIILDAVDPNQITEIGSLQNYPGAGYNHASWMSSDGDFLIMADETHGSPMKIVDIRNYNNIQAISIFSPYVGSIAHNPYVKDCLAFISYYHMGVQVYDISNPVAPLRTAYFDTDTTTGNGNFSGYASNWGVFPYLPSGNILASDRNKGLYILSYDGIQPSCTGNFDKIVQSDFINQCDSTVSSLNYDESEKTLDFNIYPNPTQSNLIIDFDNNSEEEIRIQIYNTTGQLIYEQLTGLSDVNIDISRISSGVYLVNIFSVSKKSYSKKKIFLKQ